MKMKKIEEEMMYIKQDLENLKAELGSYELELVDDIENRMCNVQEVLCGDTRHPMYISIIYTGEGGFEHHVAHDMFSAKKCVDELMQKYWGEHLVGTDEKDFLPLLYENGVSQIRVELKDEDEVVEIE